MFLEYTISQLDIGPMPPDRADEMGHLGFLQWLGALPGDRSFAQEAERALMLSLPAAGYSPALAVFCDLVARAVAASPAPLTLRLPQATRRGGARARRVTP